MTLDTKTVERLVQEISRAIVEHMGPAGAAEDERPCLDCDGQCAQRCPDKVRVIIQNGASRLSAQPGVNGLRGEFARYIDHTLLKPEATVKEIVALCHEALQYSFASVCINPTHVKLAAQLLNGSPVKVCTVIGFPLGANSAKVKRYETEQALADGATEVDMVLNIGALKGGDDDLVQADIAGVCQAAHRGGAICKVILETALLSDAEKTQACLLARKAGADYVKTSTGFGGGGATAHDVALMRQAVGSSLGVKAAGGIRSYADAREMIKAGATRIGASAGVKITQEARG